MGIIYNFFNGKGLYSINPSKNEIWLESCESERSLGEFINLINSAEKELKLVCGELDPKIYEDEKVIKALGNFLKKGGRLKIIFSSPCEEFKNCHPNLFKLFKKRGLKGLVDLYPAKKRPMQHFTLADTKNLLIEAPNHLPFGKRPSIIIYNDDKFGLILEKKFEEYIGKLGSGNVCRI